MRTNYTSSERFKILNSKYLGYGNPSKDVNIVFIGIEEYGGWSIKELLFDRINNDIENYLNIKSTLNKKILGLKEKFDIDVIQILDDQISGMNKQFDKTPFIYNNPKILNSNKYSPTNKRQFLISKKIKNLNDKDYQIFATELGNEVVANYYPLGRSSENKHYPELEYFFGLTEGRKFLSEEDEIRRKRLFSNFFQRLRENTDEKIYLLVMGLKKTKTQDSVCHLLFDSIRESFELPYNSITKMLEDSTSFEYGYRSQGYSLTNKNHNIYFLPHPNNYRGLFENYANFLNI